MNLTKPELNNLVEALNLTIGSMERQSNAKKATPSVREAYVAMKIEYEQLKAKVYDALQKMK